MAFGPRHLPLRIALLAMLGAAAPAAAQGRIIDEGTFSVTLGDGSARTESFRIARTDSNVITATANLSAGTRRVRSTLTTDSLGTPLSYRVNVTDRGAAVSDLNASAHGGRLSALSHGSQRGDETMREYPVAVGRCLIVDDDLIHELYFAAVTARAGRVEVISPRSAHSTSGSLTARGLAPVDVAGKTVTATHYTLDGGMTRDFWVDQSGRLLRVEIPSLGLKAVREELPR